MAAPVGWQTGFSLFTKMNTPQFFAWDNFEQYSLGSISSLTKNVSWAAAGIFVDRNVLISSDNFQSYTNGTTASLAGGTGWLANGVFTIY